MSRKSANKKAGIRRSKVTQICPSSVYVGNVSVTVQYSHLILICSSQLMPTVTENVLQRMFAPCGTIDAIQLRCSQGRGIIPGLALSEYFSTDRAYATVTFATPSSAEKALKLNRCILHQVRIVVYIPNFIYIHNSFYSEFIGFSQCV
jgi:RNA recognition motif-containing protein